MADGLEAAKSELQEANRVDLAEGERAGLSRALIDRLTLSEAAIVAMAGGLREVASQADPVGEVVEMWKRPNGLMVGKKRIPLGVIGIIVLGPVDKAHTDMVEPDALYCVLNAVAMSDGHLLCTLVRVVREGEGYALLTPETNHVPEGVMESLS
jgi:hypothetical protein